MRGDTADQDSNGVAVSATYYKVLDLDGSAFHGGSGKWHMPSGKRPGKWMPAISDPKPCVRGYHLCRDTTDLSQWLGPSIWLAEARGAIVADGNKIVVAQARLIRRLPWDDRTARLFAADCAERVLPIFERERPNDDRPRKAIETARRFANGEVEDAARAAAEAAAEAAAWGCRRGCRMGFAAEAAAWAAAQAAQAAAQAAQDAAQAAQATAQAAQAIRLGWYLAGEGTP